MFTCPRPSRRRRRSRSLLGAGVASVTLLAGPLLPAPAPAEPVSTDPQVAAQATAAWLVTQVNPQGFVPTPADTPNVGATLDVALALAASGTQRTTFDRIVDWLRADTTTAIAPDGPVAPGNIGQLLMVAAIAGESPTSFGGTDLVAALAGTLGAYEPGLYGDADPSFDGVFRQSLAILGLRANGLTVPTAALDWLVNQQCGGGATPSAAVGGWQAYRADLSVECTAPDPNTFTGPDTNSTALAIEALVAASRAASYDGLDFVLAAREGDGGFGFLPGAGSDPNSTALVIQAIEAAGQDPTGAPWTVGAVGPLASLLSWQLGCSAPATDRGALTSPYSDGAPDQFASRQAPWGLAGRPFPLGTVTWQAFVDPCSPSTTTSTSTTPTIPMASTTSVQTVPTVQATPRLAG